jgi:hypothetical protein
MKSVAVKAQAPIGQKSATLAHSHKTAEAMKGFLTTPE